MRMKTLNNKGVALVTVVLFFLVLVILLGGVMFSSISNQGNAILSKEHTSAYYVAESGLNVSIEQLKNWLAKNSYSSIPYNQFADKKAALESYLLTPANWPTGTLSGMSPNGSYSVQVSKIIDDEFLIRVTGTVNGVSRTVQGTFDYDTILAPMAKAVIAKGSITMANDAHITGPIASLMLGTNPTVSVNDCNIDEVYVPEAYYNVTTTSVSIGACNEKKKIDGAVTFNDFTLPSYSTTNLITLGMDHIKDVTEKMNDSSSTDVPIALKKITLPPLEGKDGYFISTLPIDKPIKFELGVGASDRVLKLIVGDLANDGRNGAFPIKAINVQGDGKLMVLITVDSGDTSSNSGNPEYAFSWGGNVNVGQNDMSKFQLVVKKGNGFPTNPNTVDPVFTIPNNNTYIGSILMDYVNLQLGNLTFKGFIGTLGKSITTKSNSTISGPMWIYAPYADVSLQSNSFINGSVMANSVDITSGGKIEYKSFTGTVPYNLYLPIFMGGSMVPVGITVKFINFKEV